MSNSVVPTQPSAQAPVITSPAKVVKPEYTVRPFDAHPSVWLSSLPKNTLCLKDIEYLFPDVAPELTTALVTDPAALSPFEILLADSNEPTASGLTLIEWLRELSDTLIRQSASTNVINRLSAALSRPFNDDVYSLDKGSYREYRINTTHFSALFCLSKHVEYDSGLGCFFIYNGNGAWLPASEPQVRRELIYFLSPYSQQNMEIYNPKTGTYQEILFHAKAIALHKPAHWEKRYLICARNSVVSILTQNENIEAFPHAPAYKLRNQIPVDYDKTRLKAPKFEEWMGQVLDADDLKIFQYWCGMVLLGINPKHQILVVSGEGGAGKSTLLNLLEKMIGRDNVATLSTERLEERFEMSEFLNKSLLLGKDVSANFLSKKSAHVLKSLSGDSGIKAEVKFVQQRVRLGGPYNIGVIANSKLRVKLEGDEAAWRRRLWVLDFKARPLGKDGKKPTNIPDFEDKLLATEGPAILNWMLRGAREFLQKIRLRQPIALTPAQNARLDAMFAEPGGIDEFVALQVKRDAKGTLTTDELYESYSKYCYRNECEPARQTVFERRIGIPLFKTHKAEHGNVQKDGGPIRKGYRGVTLLPEPAEPVTPAVTNEASESDQTEPSNA